MNDPALDIQKITDRGWKIIPDPTWGAAGATWRVCDKEGRLVGYFPGPAQAVHYLKEFAATVEQEVWDSLVLDPDGGRDFYPFCKACGDPLDAGLCAACIVELADEEGRL